MSTPQKIIPVATAADCSLEWIAARREIIQRCRFPVRAGARNTIELRSLTPVEQLAKHDPLKLNPWVPMILPNDARNFATSEDRDAILQRLQQGHTDEKAKE